VIRGSRVYFSNSTITKRNTNKENYMSQGFETKTRFESEEMVVLIEATTYSGSGFGVNEDGDAVFFSKRLMDKVELEEGDEVVAHCIPNYVDKRDDIPWRCIKCELLED
jgi:hypothetical protein